MLAGWSYSAVCWAGRDLAPWPAVAGAHTRLLLLCWAGWLVTGLQNKVIVP